MNGEHAGGSALAPARLALAAAALAALGQALLARQGLPVPTPTARFRWGVALLCAGVAAFGWASRRLSPPPAFAEEEDAGPWPFAFGLAPAVGLAFAIVLGLIASGESAWTRWAWLASVALLFRPVRGERPRLRRPRLDVAAAVAAVLLAAFALRALDRARLPLAFHGDMATMGLGGRALLHGEVPAIASVGWASIPWPGFLPAALGLAASDDLAGLRLSSALLGTAAVAGVYLLGALLFGRTIGLVAAGASTVGYAEIHFSRLQAYGDPVPFVVFALYFLVRGLRRDERLSFVASGALTGAACLLYYSGRVAVVLAAAVLLHALAVRPSLLARRRRGLAAAALSAAVVVAPMLPFFTEHPEELTARLRDVSVFNPDVARHLRGAYEVGSLAQVIALQAVRSVLTLHHTTDTSLQFGFPRPLLNPLLAPLAALGLGACLGRLRAPGPAMLVAWWALALAAVTVTADAPFWPRLVVLLPAAALLTALGFDRVLDAMAVAAARPLSGRVRLLAAGVLLAVVGALNWSWYTARARVHVDAAEWLGRLVAAEPGARFCMVPGPLSFREEEVLFLAPGRDLREVEARDVASCIAEKRVFVVYPEQTDVLGLVRARSPGAREVAHDLPEGGRGPLFLYPTR